MTEQWQARISGPYPGRIRRWRVTYEVLGSQPNLLDPDCWAFTQAGAHEKAQRGLARIREREDNHRVVF